MENKQTAVQWLFDELIKHNGIISTEIIEKAIAMEREQIIEAYDDAYIAMNLAFRGFDRSVEYYEKTYNAHNNGNSECLP